MVLAETQAPALFGQSPAEGGVLLPGPGLVRARSDSIRPNPTKSKWIRLDPSESGWAGMGSSSPRALSSLKYS